MPGRASGEVPPTRERQPTPSSIALSMAPPISELVTVSIANRQREIRDNVINNNGFLRAMQEGNRIKTVDGGTSIYEEISYAPNSNGGWYTNWDLLPMGAQNVLTAAEFDWKQYAVGVVISGLEELKNSGKERMIELISARIDNAEATMANAIATGLYSDGSASGGRTITGLDAAVPQDPTTGTYGGIDASTNTFWRSQVYSLGTAPTASNILPAMNSLYASCTVGAQRTNLIVAGQTAWVAYLNTLQGIQRLTDTKLGEAGFSNINYMPGCPVVLDNITGVVSADMYFLNTNHLKFRPHRDRNMVPLPGGDRAAFNQDAHGRILAWAGNLTCSGRRYQGRLKGS